MPSCGQRRFPRFCEEKVSPAQHSYVEKRRADIRRPVAVADMQVYCFHSLAIQKLLRWQAGVALVLLRLLCGKE
jgi:hypothetical protein